MALDSKYRCDRCSRPIPSAPDRTRFVAKAASGRDKAALEIRLDLCPPCASEVKGFLKARKPADVPA